MYETSDGNEVHVFVPATQPASVRKAPDSRKADRSLCMHGNNGLPEGSRYRFPVLP